MARERVGAGSAPNEEANAPEPPVDANASRGTPTALGGPKGVRVMFNAVQRDEKGELIMPGERVVSAEDATALVKQGIATIL